MQTSIGRSMRVLLAMVALSIPFALGGCGGGGGVGGAYLTIEFAVDQNSPNSITKFEFDYFDISLLADRVEVVNVGQGGRETFGFDAFQADSLFDVTITWSDGITTPIVLVPFTSGGGQLFYPLSR